MIPEKNPVEVEAAIRHTITQATAERAGLSVEIKRLLLANAMTPLAGNQPLVDAIQKHAQAVIGEPVPAVGTLLYTDVRLYVERGHSRRDLRRGATHRAGIARQTRRRAAATGRPAPGHQGHRKALLRDLLV